MPIEQEFYCHPGYQDTDGVVGKQTKKLSKHKNAVKNRVMAFTALLKLYVVKVVSLRRLEDESCMHSSALRDEMTV